MTDPVALFGELFGASPQGIWRAPGRVNLIGEHTDYNGGLVLPFAVELSTVVYARLRDDRLIRVASLQAPTVQVIESDLDSLVPQVIAGWQSYPLGVIWALRDHGLKQGCDILIDGAVPLGSGLSSSAALECAVGLAVSDLASLNLDRLSLALAAQRGENEIAGVSCGIMDQCASLLCRASHALLLDASSLTYRQVAFHPASFDLALLVVNAGSDHRLSSSPYSTRRSECRQASQQLGLGNLGSLAPGDLEAVLPILTSDTLRRRVTHVVTENDRVRQVVSLLEAERIDELGPFLTASHRSLADHFQVSTPELDTIVDSALAAGALGARMVGGGFGGSAIILVQRNRVQTVLRDVADSCRRACNLDIPYFFVADPSEGASRIG